jgi:hypothetical protein
MKMLRTVLTASAILAAWNPASAATIGLWTFETSPPADLNNSTTSPTFTADSGSGTASGVHASAATDWTTPAGNGSANSFSVNTWAVNDYFQFQVSTIGLSDIVLSWDQAGSGTGPRDFQLQYSTDGVSFTTFTSYTVALSTWSAGTPMSGFTHSYDLSAITALNNDSDVFFRLVNNSTVSIGGGTVAAAGTDRVDNFLIATVPEPTTWAGLIFGAIFCGTQVVRRLRSKRAAANS